MLGKNNLFFLFAVSFLVMNHVSAAEAVPVSRCITAATTAVHANATARMQKDIAAYEKVETAAAAIKKYQENMQIAWDALHEPYCGYGAYGAASAVKSYSKSIERARSAFLGTVQKLPTSKIALSSSAVSAQPVSPKKEGAIPTGLHVGVRSPAVTLLQKMLLTHFHLPLETSMVTGFFGPKTEALVKKFQIEQRVVDSEYAHGAGLVGPKTAAALNAL